MKFVCDNNVRLTIDELMDGVPHCADRSDEELENFLQRFGKCVEKKIKKISECNGDEKSDDDEILTEICVSIAGIVVGALIMLFYLWVKGKINVWGKHDETTVKVKTKLENNKKDLNKCEKQEVEENGSSEKQEVKKEKIDEERQEVKEEKIDEEENRSRCRRKNESIRKNNSRRSQYFRTASAPLHNSIY